ncbi:MAG: hypothetical protein K2N18_05745, partial [Clostridia bacterium]|nr:hypothetical protein [Clostridia bacterium]
LYPCSSGLQNTDGVLSWKNYVSVGYSDPATGGDGYYHLLDSNGDPNGPYVLANMVYANSHWSENSVFTYAYNNLCIFNGVDYNGKIVDYAGYSSYSTVQGYVPVTKELHDILVLMAANLGGSDHVTYANEWLEMCNYYIHYGVGADTINASDPIKGLAPFSAYEVHDTTNAMDDGDYNQINISNPLRGIYYAFTPETTAVYKFTSKNAKGLPDSNGNPTVAQSDPLCWIENAAGEELGGANADIGGNFEFYLPMRAGVTYYVRCCFSYPGDMGSYLLGIENVGDSVSILTLVTGGAYTFDLKLATEQEVYYNVISTVPNKDLIRLNDENEWVVMDKHGNEMSKIYLDMTHPTNLTETSIKNVLYPPTGDDGNPVTYIYSMKDDFGNPIYKPDYKPEDSAGEDVVDIKK